MKALQNESREIVYKDRTINVYYSELAEPGIKGYSFSYSISHYVKKYAGTAIDIEEGFSMSFDKAKKWIDEHLS